MRTITLKTARAIAADWHGGQWSALYAFASSGVLNAAQEPQCLTEVEYELSSPDLSDKQRMCLEKLKQFVTHQAQKMENQLIGLIKRLSDEGLKETRDIALHSDSIEDFISYMEADIAERESALHIAMSYKKAK